MYGKRFGESTLVPPTIWSVSSDPSVGIGTSRFIPTPKTFSLFKPFTLKENKINLEIESVAVQLLSFPR